MQLCMLLGICVHVDVQLFLVNLVSCSWWLCHLSSLNFPAPMLDLFRRQVDPGLLANKSHIQYLLIFTCARILTSGFWMQTVYGAQIYRQHTHTQQYLYLSLPTHYPLPVYLPGTMSRSPLSQAQWSGSMPSLSACPGINGTSTTYGNLFWDLLYINGNLNGCKLMAPRTYCGHLYGN